MGAYRRIIDLRAIWIAIRRRFWLFFSLLVPTVSIAVALPMLLVKKTFQSSVSLSKENAFNNAQYVNLANLLKTESFLSSAVTNLENERVFHSDGRPVSRKEVSQGVGLEAFTYNSISVVLTFESPDVSITKPTLLVLSDLVVDEAQTSFSEFSHLSRSSSVTDPIKNSKEVFYAIAGATGALLLSFAIPVAVDLRYDLVFDENDIESFGFPVFVSPKSANPKGRRGAGQGVKSGPADTSASPKKEALDQNLLMGFEWFLADFVGTKVMISLSESNDRSYRFALSLGAAFARSGFKTLVLDTNVSMSDNRLAESVISFFAEEPNVIVFDRDDKIHEVCPNLSVGFYPSVSSSCFLANETEGVGDKALGIKFDRIVFIAPEPEKARSSLNFLSEVDLAFFVCERNKTAKKTIFDSAQFFARFCDTKIALL